MTQPNRAPVTASKSSSGVREYTHHTTMKAAVTMAIAKDIHIDGVLRGGATTAGDVSARSGIRTSPSWFDRAGAILAHRKSLSYSTAFVAYPRRCRRSRLAPA